MLMDLCYEFMSFFYQIKHKHAQHTRVFFLAGWVEMEQYVYLMLSFLQPKKA